MCHPPPLFKFLISPDWTLLFKQKYPIFLKQKLSLEFLKISGWKHKKKTQLSTTDYGTSKSSGQTRKPGAIGGESMLTLWGIFMTYFISLWLQKEMQLLHKEILMPWKKKSFYRICVHWVRLRSTFTLHLASCSCILGQDKFFILVFIPYQTCMASVQRRQSIWTGGKVWLLGSGRELVN